MSAHTSLIADELQLNAHQVDAVTRLLDDGATIPFLARYRKEATGSLDEVAIAAIRDRREKLRALEKRRTAILESLAERGLLNDTRRLAIEAAGSLTRLEDFYLPYRQKRKTRASIAASRGLEPLAELLLRQDGRPVDARAFVNPSQEVADADAALAGARDILAERFAEDAEIRAELRRLFQGEALLTSKVVRAKEKEAAQFRDWFAWKERLARAPSHRVLAILRGKKEGFLRVHALPDEDAALSRLSRRFMKGHGFQRDQVLLALTDAWHRLLAPSLENEILKSAKERADAEAIKVFAENMRDLLLAAPLGRQRVIALDPGFRTGCKVVALDEQGQLLENATIYPHSGAGGFLRASEELRLLIDKHRPDCIAVGNGTAGRETEEFVRGVTEAIAVVLVDESGASIYSASELAREEFPDHDVTVRGSVSIGRRLQDPLAELVKLDPKSIGVGQYQHDVDQKALKSSLDDVVSSCVNRVGVELNSASERLLTYVAGLGPQQAQNVVKHRNEHGPFRRRRALLDVPKLGARAFQQCAGFLRIRAGDHPLDGSAVHPERYALVERMAKDLGCRVADLMTDESMRQRICLEKYVSDDVGEPTLKDILAELSKPGRDPRPAFKPFHFADVREPKDLTPGMRLPGIVTNVTNFGAFVDIGVHCDGLVHISQLADHFVDDPRSVVRIRQEVTVTVLEVDLERQRISLSLRGG